MLINLQLALIFIFIFTPVGYSLDKNMNLFQLNKLVNDEISKYRGTFAVAFKEVNNNENKLMINEQVVFHAASTMKTPVMVEVFRQAISGNFSLDDSLIVKNKFKSIVDSSEFSLNINDDGDDKIYSMINQKRRIYDLIYDMITVSSNLATNLLIELVGAENVTNTMKNYGLNNITVLRGVEDIKAFELGLINTVTAEDLLRLYELIAMRAILDSNSCDEIIKILLSQQFREKIPKLLPDNVKVAHKTGNISRVEHDCGIVFLPDGRKYVLVVLSKDLEDNLQGKEIIAKISKHIYDYMTN